jgi:L-iditol 2-dehydrogenase
MATAQSMKAVVLHANQRMSVDDIPLKPLQPDLCRVALRHVGVCSSDIVRSSGNGAYHYPLIMGHEMAGEVVEVGSAVENLKQGERVAIFPLLPCFKCDACAREAYAQCVSYDYYGSRRDGGYAEYLDVKPWNLLKLPADVDLADAAAIEPLSVVIHALKRIGLYDVDLGNAAPRVAILGAGFLGNLLAQVLSNRCPQAIVTLIDRNQSKLDLAASFAAENIKISGEAEWRDFIKQKNAFYDVVVEATGTPSLFTHALDLARQEGKVVWMSNITGDLTIQQNAVSRILRKELRIYGTWNSTYRPGQRDDWQDALDMIKAGIRPRLLVTHKVGLDEVADTLLRLHRHKTGQESFSCLKAMVDF